jgi:hypothetical protein
MALRCCILLLPLALPLTTCGSVSSVRQSANPLDYATLVERLRADGRRLSQRVTPLLTQS